jgi:hypothetical protein
MGRRTTGRKRVPTLAQLSPEFFAPTPVQFGNRLVTRAEWIDPADSNPNRRAAKLVHGWRKFDPLRRLNTHLDITLEQLAAADFLRRHYDVARLGLTGPRQPWLYADPLHGPMTGFSRAALAQAKAARAVARCLKIFNREQRECVEQVILNNVAFTSWWRSKGVGRQRAKMVLLMVLDLLVTHYASEIIRHGLAA